MKRWSGRERQATAVHLQLCVHSKVICILMRLLNKFLFPLFVPDLDQYFLANPLQDVAEVHSIVLLSEFPGNNSEATVVVGKGKTSYVKFTTGKTAII